MLSHQERVVEEKKELDDKIEKLDAFINSEKIHTVDPPEQDRLILQLDIMKMYSNILLRRIIAFTPVATFSSSWDSPPSDIIQDLKDVTAKVMANKSPYQQDDGTFLAKD